MQMSAEAKFILIMPNEDYLRFSCKDKNFWPINIVLKKKIFTFVS
jgi:hypothetical protein